MIGPGNLQIIIIEKASLSECCYNFRHSDLGVKRRNQKEQKKCSARGTRMQLAPSPCITTVSLQHPMANYFVLVTIEKRNGKIILHYTSVKRRNKYNIDIFF